ncbi:MAG: hypothetical protein ACXWDN_22085, partial [Limisphaerales bacterium]
MAVGSLALALERFSSPALPMLIGPIEANARPPQQASNASSHQVGNNDYCDQHTEEQMLRRVRFANPNGRRNTIPKTVNSISAATSGVPQYRQELANLSQNSQSGSQAGEAINTQMRMQFYDRYEAGEFLAEQLTVYANKPNVIVLALTSGGAAVALNVARRLHLPLTLLEEAEPDFSPPRIKGQT